jgi:hypothetical protein
MKKLRVHGCAIKVEAQYGVDSVPTAAANAVQLDESPWNAIEVKFLERNERPNVAGQDWGYNTGGAQPAGRYAEFSIVLPMRGAADYATIPDMDVVLQAAGFTRADAAPAANQRTWSPVGVNSQASSVTAYLWAGGYLFKVVGVRGSITFPALPARTVPITFKGMGLVLEDPVEAALPAFTYRNRAVKAPVVSNAALTLDTFAPRYHSVTFDMATEIVQLPRGNAAGGHAGYEIVDYRPTLKTSIDNPTLASFNPWALDASAAYFGWSLGLLAGAAFNRFSVLGPAAQIVGLSHGEKDKMATLELTLGLCRDDAAQATPPIRFVQT